MASFLSIYSVESLDARISSRSSESVKQRATEPRWNTPEYWFYAAIFVVFVPLMLYAGINAGSPSHPNYEKFAHLLSPGWLGRPVDNSDAQYSAFRSQFFLLVVVCLIHVGARRVSKKITRSSYDVVTGLIFIVALHGIGSAKILGILYVNYLLKDLKHARTATWVFGVASLFANELLQGYPLTTYIPPLGWLERFGGLMPRWEVFFKCTILRMISFNIDYIEATNKQAFTLEHCLGYVLYPPLYLAGPIMSFNEFHQQKKTEISLKIYIFRFVGCMITMEFILHYIPVVAISTTRAWDGDTPAQVSMIGFFNLVIIWLKLLIPWRFFRLWALLDGVDPPENMIRCVANNYSATSFWRSWHRSFHLWVTKYLYIPLGGSKRPLINSLIVFTFVAAWHDIQLRLFVWSGLIVLFVMPEMAARQILPASKYGHNSWYRIACGAGAVVNIWMMLIANLVGFAVGPEGIGYLLHEMFSTAQGLWFAILCSCLLFVGAQVMFEVRQRERRNGIDLKC